jgi:hypothetical protein
MTNPINPYKPPDRTTSSDLTQSRFSQVLSRVFRGAESEVNHNRGEITKEINAFFRMVEQTLEKCPELGQFKVLDLGAQNYALLKRGFFSIHDGPLRSLSSFVNEYNHQAQQGHEFRPTLFLLLPPSWQPEHERSASGIPIWKSYTNGHIGEARAIVVSSLETKQLIDKINSSSFQEEYKGIEPIKTEKIISLTRFTQELALEAERRLAQPKDK